MDEAGRLGREDRPWPPPDIDWYYADDYVAIAHGDCRDVLPKLKTRRLDAIVTDPPYGVGLGEVKNGQAVEKRQQSYSLFSDTPEYLAGVVIPAFKYGLSLAKRAIITPGNRNAFLYPSPHDVGVWYNPAGTGRGKWGFILAHLIFYYGKDPRAGIAATASSCWGHNDSVDAIKQAFHPCPKPLLFTRWLVAKATLECETVLDPFMGSGTTLVAAKQLGRKAIGIEIEERYCDVAIQRLAQVPMIFEEREPEPKQLALASQGNA